MQVSVTAIREMIRAACGEAFQTLVLVTCLLGASTPVTADAAVEKSWSESQRIQIYADATSRTMMRVSVGIPFAPGILKDAAKVRVLGADGVEIPAHVQSTLLWHFRDDSIRAVRAQFAIPMDGSTATAYFTIDRPRTLEGTGWPYVEGLVDGEAGLRVPAVLATLTPEWLTASLIAGPQLPAQRGNAYDGYVDTQFAWAEKLPAEDSTAWLFDRTTTLFKQYVRTGRADYLRAASLSYRFYMGHLRRSGRPFPYSLNPHECVGGWQFMKVNPCDVKYIYVEPILLALGLTGDDSEHDTALVSHMIGLWASGGWSGISGAYTRLDQPFTERHAGLGLIQVVSAFEVTGDIDYRRDMERRIGALSAHQQRNPDGLPADGSWRHSWQVHEGEAYDPATDVRGASPWMSENIVDGLWHAWLVVEDARIPPMLTAFGRYLEKYGWIDTAALITPTHDWRDPCSGPDGQIAWYWSSSSAPVERLAKIEDSDGWYSDYHNVELALAVAAARYFETDAVQRAALNRRLARLAGSYSVACAKVDKTPRRFNWNNRGAGAVQWLQGHQYVAPPAGSQ